MTLSPYELRTLREKGRLRTRANEDSHEEVIIKLRGD